MEKEIKKRQKELNTTLAEKLFNRAHHGNEALIEIHFFDFLILFFVFSLSCYH
jgi:hypothetical protein